MKTVMAITKSDVDGSNAHNVSSDAQEASVGDQGSEAIVAQRGGYRRKNAKA